MINADFTATAYGRTLKGSCDAFGWTANDESQRILNALAPAQRRRAALRCKRAASLAHMNACRRA